MVSFLCFVVGMFIGTCITLAIMCVLQINRINEYENEICKLKDQIKEKDIF